LRSLGTAAGYWSSSRRKAPSFRRRLHTRIPACDRVFVVWTAPHPRLHFPEFRPRLRVCRPQVAAPSDLFVLTHEHRNRLFCNWQGSFGVASARSATDGARHGWESEDTARWPLSPAAAPPGSSASPPHRPSRQDRVRLTRGPGATSSTATRWRQGGAGAHSTEMAGRHRPFLHAFSPSPRRESALSISN